MKSELLVFALLLTLCTTCDLSNSNITINTNQMEDVDTLVESQLFRIKENGKYGYIDHSGNVVITPQFEEANHFSEGIAMVKTRNKWGYIDKNGQYVINPQFDDRFYFSEGLAPVKLGDKWGYINKVGEFIIDPQFESVSIFSEGLAAVWFGDKCGYITEQGKLTINPLFDDANFFSEGMAAIEIGDKWGYINEHGQVVINPQFDEASYFSEGLAIVKFGEKYGCINKDGKYAINPLFDHYFSFTQGLAVVMVNGKCGYINIDGEFVINPQFDHARSFSEGLAAVELAGRWGYIDKEGKYVINPQFDVASDFIEGLAQVRIDGKYGYIDKDGKFVINPGFDFANGFSKGLALVRIGKEEGYINKEGIWIWQSHSQDNSNKSLSESTSQTRSPNVSDSQSTITQGTQWPTYSISDACSITVPLTMELRDENSNAGKLFSVINPLLFKLICEDCDVFSDHSKIVFQPEGMNSDNPQDIDRATSTYARIIIEFGYNYDVSQEDIKSMTADDIAEYDDAIGKQYKSEFDYTQQALGKTGSFVWYPVKREKLGGKYCLVLDYDRSGLQGMVKVKKYLFYYNGKEIDITCSYRISEKQKYEKDFEKVIRTVKFD